MYGPKWPFLLWYESRDTRRIDFPRVDGLLTDTPGFGASQEVNAILRCWEPFHRGASAADRLNSLYPSMYRVPVAARGMGLHEDYSVPLPASTPKEDFL